MLAGESENICVVGDDDQSIYSWRGADINNILDFEKDFRNAKIIKLEQNYRSNQIILDAANGVIKNNLGRKSKNLWTEQKGGEKIIFYRASDYKLEAKFLAEQILNNRDKFDLKNCAVLYRNNFLSRVIEDEFVKKNIAYRLIGATRFYDRMEIKDLIAYLKFINNPDDEISLLRIINTPRRGIGGKSLEKVMSFASQEKISLWEALKIFADNNKNFGCFVEMINLFLDYKEKYSIYDLMQKIIFEIGYKEYLEKQEEYVSRLENIEEFLAKIIEFERGQESKKSLTEFLEQISLLSETDNYDKDENAVSLMTLHGSKGLEFDCVFIFGADDDIFPSNFKSDIELEEERRLFYVGITRAKKKLFISCADARLRNGQIMNSKPSRFIEEIPSELIDFESDRKKIAYADFNKKKSDFGFYVGKNFYDDKKNIEKDIKLNYTVGDKVRNFKLGVCIVKEILFLADKNDYKVKVELLDGSEKILMASLVKFIKC